MSEVANGAEQDVVEDFAPVLEAELASIEQARHRQTKDAQVRNNLVKRQDGASPYGNAQSMRLAGLAFSGGGIRSATFNLGIVQALCTLNLIGRFDYLSTVSGGGYIGSWLSALIRARGAPDYTAAALADKLSTNGKPGRAEEDRAVSFLRAYSNYLTPKLGLLSTDALAGVSAYLRNLILVQTTIIALLVFVLMLPRALYALLWFAPEACQCIDIATANPLCLAVSATVLWSISVLGISGNMHSKAPAWIRGPGFVWVAVLIPGVLGSIAWSIALMMDIATVTRPETAMAAVKWIVWMTLFGAAANLGAAAYRGDFKTRSAHAFKMVLCGAIGGAIGGAGFELLQDFMQAYGGTASNSSLRWLALSVGPFAVLQIMSLGVVFYLGLLGRLLDHQTHEWWARYGAYILALSIGIGGLFIISVYGPVLIGFGRDWVVYGGGPLWLLTSAWGLYKGASSDSKGDSASWTERALSIAPYIYIFGLTLLLSWATYALTVSFDKTAPETPAVYIEKACKEWLPSCEPGTDSKLDRRCEPAKSPCLAETLRSTGDNMADPAHTRTVLIVLVSAGVLWLLLAWRVDINLFSFHNFYRNRLTRCYLGGARMGAERLRKPHPFTGFDKDDDFNLGELVRPDGVTVCRPFHILNTAINMSSGHQLAWQQRKAGSFFFSPLYCGYQLPATAEYRRSAGGFARTTTYMWSRAALAAAAARQAQDAGKGSDKADSADGRPEGGAMLGSVMAISGAAASPNWGFHTSSAVAFVLTMFNIRLGRWCPNPTPAEGSMPQRTSPLMGGWLLLKELFGMTSASSKYVYLSDGGHFDNLGIYELVRRRVSSIVVCDCGQDPDAIFDDLADTLRKCYTDFGVVIEIDIEDLKGVSKDGGLKFSKAHCVSGTVYYPAMADGTPALRGTLLLLKPGLSEEICSQAPDIRNYAWANAEFPQQTTADQWFDEAQFESYRKLGYLIGMSVFQSFDGALPQQNS